MLLSGDETYYINITSGAAAENMFYGDVTKSLVLDAGARTRFMGKDTKYINPTDTTWIKYYFQTTGNPLTYFYGYAGGTQKYGSLQMKSTGNFEIASQSYDLELTVGSNNNITINGVLLLTPRVQPLQTATEGMLYYDSTYHKLRLYNATGWVNVTVS